MNPETGWLVRRAALAVGLMVGFYVMALAIGLGLLAIPSKWLGQFTADTIPGDLPSLKRAGAALVQAGAEHPDVDIRVVAARQILGIGLAAVLLEHGWRISTAPGRPLVLVRDADVIDPFNVVKECVEVAGAADRWKARCAAIGIAGRQLA